MSQSDYKALVERLRTMAQYSDKANRDIEREAAAAIESLSEQLERVEAERTAAVAEARKDSYANGYETAMETAAQVADEMLHEVAGGERVGKAIRALKPDAGGMAHTRFVCPYCGDALPNQRSPHCGEVGHAQEETTMSKEITFAWLIEMCSPGGEVPAGDLIYWTPSGWTKDAFEAVWFSRKIDAERCIRPSDDSKYKSVAREHSFFNNAVPRLPDAGGKVPQSAPPATQPVEAGPMAETGWVIVRDLPGTLGYFDGTHKFSRDNLKAIRFCRQEDAERALKMIHGGSEHPDRVEEHQWID